MAKRHHYLPRHYLRGFALSKQPDRTWMFDKETGRSVVTSVDNAAVQKHFYAVPNGDGGQDTDSIETFLANKVEGPAIGAIEKIRSQKRLDKHDKTALVPYLTFMHSRVPRYRERVKNALPDLMAQQRKRWAKELEEAKERELISSTQADAIMALMHEAHDQIDSNPPKEFMMPKFYDKVAAALLGMRWAFLIRSKAPHFITCDNPFTYTEGTGLKPPDGQVVFPVSKHVTLWAVWNARGDLFYHNADEGLVAAVNGYVEGNATRFMFSSTKLNAQH